MDNRKYKRFQTMGYDLTCKLCDCPIHIGDDVESKSSGKKGPKFYHAECYERFHLDFTNGKIRNGLGEIIEPDLTGYFICPYCKEVSEKATIGMPEGEYMCTNCGKVGKRENKNEKE